MKMGSNSQTKRQNSTIRINEVIDVELELLTGAPGLNR